MWSPLSVRIWAFPREHSAGEAFRQSLWLRPLSPTRSHVGLSGSWPTCLAKAKVEPEPKPAADLARQCHLPITGAADLARQGHLPITGAPSSFAGAGHCEPCLMSAQLMWRQTSAVDAPILFLLTLSSEVPRGSSPHTSACGIIPRSLPWCPLILADSNLLCPHSPTCLSSESQTSLQVTRPPVSFSGSSQVTSHTSVCSLLTPAALGPPLCVLVPPSLPTPQT